MTESVSVCVTESVSVCAAGLPAAPPTVDDVHRLLERLWLSADHVPLSDRMAFDLAVIETVTNSVRHCVADPGPVELGIELTAAPLELCAIITEYGAARPGLGPVLSPDAPGPGGPAAVDHAAPEAVLEGAPPQVAESGRGLALIQTLVSLGFERAGTTNVWRLRRRTGVPA